MKTRKRILSIVLTIATLLLLVLDIPVTAAGTKKVDVLFTHDTHSHLDSFSTIVDGQQRLTTNYKAYTDSEDFRNIVLDLIKGRFLLVEGAIERYQIPVGKLLNKEDSVFYSYVMNSKYLRKENVLPVLLQCRTKIRNYYYTINQADDLSEDEQIEWFEVLNNAGSRVSAYK